MAKLDETKDIAIEKVKDIELTKVVDIAPIIEETEDKAAIEERVIAINRVSRTQAGGRRMRFRATVVVGDRQGNVGLGIGKSNEITSAVAKATYSAKKNMFTVPIVRQTIPHEIVSQFGTAKVLLKPAAIGTSIIAGSSVRPILELAGVENVVGKCLTRTTNKLNNAYATIVALKSLLDIKEIAPRKYRKLKHKLAKPDLIIDEPKKARKTKPSKLTTPKE